MLVGRRMTKDVIVVSPKDTLLHSLDLLRWNNIRHLPVMDDGKLVGIITDRDIRTVCPSRAEVSGEDARAALDKTLVDHVMSTSVVTVDALTPIEEAAKLLHDHRIGCLPVVSDDTLEGIITQTDVLAAFIEIMGVHEPSSRLEVEIESAPGPLATVINVIKEHNVGVSSIVTTPSDDGRKRIAVIRLKTINPQAIVKALKAADLSVPWPPS